MGGVGVVSVGSVTVDVLPDARGFDRALSAQLNPAATRAGEEYGRRFADGVRAGLASSNNPDVNIGVDTGRASAEVDAFLVETKAKTAAASREMGDNNGSLLATGMRNGIMRSSPLIVSAVAGGLILGAPAVAAAGLLLFGGLSAAAASNVGSVQDAFHSMSAHVMNSVQGMAEGTAGEFVGMAGDIQTGFDKIEPSIRSAMASGAVDIHQVVGALVQASDTAIPAFTRALQQGEPVVMGLDTLIRDVGSGVAGLMDQITAHSGASGQVLAGLGKTVQILLPTLGQLVGEGAELGQDVLPVFNAALQGTSNLLHLIGPALPEIVVGLLGFKAVSLLSGPLDRVALKLGAIDQEGNAVAGSTSRLGNSARTASASLPLVGAAVSLLAVAFETGQQDADKFRGSAEQLFQQLNDGGAAADHAQAKLDLMRQAAEHPPVANGWFSDSLSESLDKAKTAAAQAQQEMGPLALAQQKVTQAQNDYLTQAQKYGESSGQAAGAADTLRDAESNLASVQGQVNGVTGTAAGNMANLKGNLQLTADAASQANTEIGLLKGALDALTGANVTLDQAQIAVTVATDAITQAVKGHSAALTFNKGVLDLSNAGSAQASQLLIQLAGNMHQQIATMKEQGDSADKVNAQTDALRQQFIKSAEQMGANAAEAKALADRYFGIPDQVHTALTADAAQANGVLDAVQTRINELMTDHVVHLSAVLQTGNMIGGLGFNAAKATGGPIFGPGTGTSDTAGLFALSNGEHVWTASEVSAAGGHAAVEALRANALSRGMAAGGAVDRINVTAADSGFGAAVGGLNQSIWQAANQIAAGATFSGTGTGAGSPFIKILGQAIAASMGYANQFSAIDYIFSHESGWNPLAQNPTSSAFGIPQFLSSTWAMYGGKTTDAATQIRDGIRYMTDRYGSPDAAAAFWQGHHWYQNGTNYVPSDQLAYLHKGEAVVPASQNQGAPYRGSGAPLVGELHVHDEVDLDLVLRQSEFRQRSGAFS